MVNRHDRLTSLTKTARQHGCTSTKLQEKWLPRRRRRSRTGSGRLYWNLRKGQHLQRKTRRPRQAGRQLRIFAKCSTSSLDGRANCSEVKRAAASGDSLSMADIEKATRTTRLPVQASVRCTHRRASKRTGPSQTGNDTPRSIAPSIKRVQGPLHDCTQMEPRVKGDTGTTKFGRKEFCWSRCGVVSTLSKTTIVVNLCAGADCLTKAAKASVARGKTATLLRRPTLTLAKAPVAKEVPPPPPRGGVERGKQSNSLRTSACSIHLPKRLAANSSAEGEPKESAAPGVSSGELPSEDEFTRTSPNGRASLSSVA